MNAQNKKIIELNTEALILTRQLSKVISKLSNNNVNTIKLNFAICSLCEEFKESLSGPIKEAMQIHKEKKGKL